jgi:uncharacterized protein YdiU (UPF0061 family)
MNNSLYLKKLDALAIGSDFVNRLPGDPVKSNYTRQVTAACYSFVDPLAFPKAHLIAWSEDMVANLGLDLAECGTELFTQVFSGSKLLAAMQPHACCYGGHQFGHWAGQLGDGRAINLGEVIGNDSQHWVLQLKGAGPTPYSRSADGLAVLRSSIREFLCSEAMHHLGIPTTRALSLIGTGEFVVRDMFYDGHPRCEPGAVVCRVAPSFVRFGSFEIFAARQEHDILKILADFTIDRDFSHLGKPCKETYLAWFREVCLRTADLIVHWMRVGFVHGVMNTDNMSITGLTIDYGPYGWLESYDPDWTPNTTDFEGRRYRFGNQPMIALWNLVQLANAIFPLIRETEPLEVILEEYKNYYEKQWLAMMRGKLGLATVNAGDEALALDLIALFRQVETDMTLFFRYLANVDTMDSPLHALEKLSPAYYGDGPGSEAHAEFQQWLSRYQARMQLENSRDDERRHAMNCVNPLYVLRNYLAQLAIEKSEQGDHSGVLELLAVLKHPYTEQDGKAHLAEKRPDWAKSRPGCSMLSCSS